MLLFYLWVSSGLWIFRNLLCKCNPIQGANFSLDSISLPDSCLESPSTGTSFCAMISLEVCKKEFWGENPIRSRLHIDFYASVEEI